MIGVIAIATAILYFWVGSHAPPMASSDNSSNPVPVSLPTVETPSSAQPAPSDSPLPKIAPTAPTSAVGDIQPDIPPLVPNPQAAPVISKITTKKRVVFMGVDDGIFKEPRAIDYIKRHHYPFTLFLADNLAGNNYSYFKPLVADADNTVEDHTLHHPQLTAMNFEQQKHEICGQADIIKKQFGNAPTLMRPPFGLYNAITQRAAAACGMKAVVLWSAKVNDGKIQYQIGNHIRPGDIMLMHFRPKMMEDLQAFTNEIESQHLTVVKLEDWLR